MRMDDLLKTIDGREYYVEADYDIEPETGDGWNEPHYPAQIVIEKVFFHGYEIKNILGYEEISQLQDQIDQRHDWDFGGYDDE